MKSFCLVIGFLGFSLGAHPSNNLTEAAKDAFNTKASSQAGIVLLRKRTITCDPSEIRLRPWNFESVDDVSVAYGSLAMCVQQESTEGIRAMLEVSANAYSKMFFEHVVGECMCQRKAALAISLLTEFHHYPLSLKMFEKARNCQCKDALPSLMHGWRYRYPHVSPLDLVDEVVSSCVHFDNPPLLYAFLSSCPFVSAGIIKSFEDAVIARNVPVGRAILNSGVLGCSRSYAKMSPALAKYRQAIRDKIVGLVASGSVLQLHAVIDDIESPFVIQMLAKSTYQPKSFVYLVNRFGSCMFKFEALAVYKSACISGNKDVFEHAFRMISQLKYNIPLVFLVLQHGARFDPTEIVQYAIAQKYTPQDSEVASCIKMMIDNDTVPSLLLNSWPQHLILSEVFTLFPRLVETGNKETILAAIGLCKQSHLFTYQRHVAYSLMCATNERGVSMLQFQKTQVDPDIHRAILSTLDPRYFGTEGRLALDYYIEEGGARRVQDFLVAFSEIFQDRITSCMEHLRNIANMMEYNLVPDPALIQLFIGAGGSWEEVALMAASNPGQEALLRQAIAEEGADPFIVDPDSGLALLDLPGLSEECREVVLMAQRKALANNERLAQLVLLLRDKDTILLVMESFRQLTVEAHRKVFDHSC